MMIQTLTYRTPIGHRLWSIKGARQISMVWIVGLGFFLFSGRLLQAWDPAAGVLDIGILGMPVLGILIGLSAILCSLWLQELLWQPFKFFRKQFDQHVKQLTSWQQCILYFSVFFLLLYAILLALALVF